MARYYGRGEGRDGDGTCDVYVPGWAQVLIDLYTSALKYEILYGTEGD